MSKVLLIIQLLFAFIVASPRLRQILEVCRHGARSPVMEVYPQNWKIPDGQLTPQGVRMHFLIGNQLRQELIEEKGFLDESFNIQQIYVRATAFNRTIMSARSQLLGLYPQGTGPSLSQTQISLALPQIAPTEIQQFVTEIGNGALQDKAASVPVHVHEGTSDLILLGYQVDCPKAHKIQVDTQQSDAFKAGLQSFQIAGLSQTIERIFGLKNFTLTDQDAWSYVDNIVATTFEYPERNIYNVTWRELGLSTAFLNYQFYEGIYGDDLVVQLSQTALFNDIVDRFRECIKNDKIIGQLQKSCADTGSPSDCAKAKTEEQNRLKFTFYSAHDTNIAGMVKFMDILQYGVPPPFASQFFFKLQSKTDTITGEEGDYYVSVQFNGATIYTFNDFPAFVNFVSSKTYNGNLVQACKIEGGGSKKSQNLFLTVGLPIIIGVLVIAAIMITIYCCCCRKKKKLLEDILPTDEREGIIRKSSFEGSNEVTSQRNSAKINKSEF